MMEKIWNTGKATSVRAIRALLDFALPARCAICADAVMDHNGLCAPCWSKLEFIDAPRCDVHGIPMPFDSGGTLLSAAAARGQPNWDRARGAVAFDDHSRRLIHALKYHDRHDVARLLARLMQRSGQDILEDADWLVPVPLYWGRLWLRRFNQAALLAQIIASQSPASYRPDLLSRRRSTRSQVGLNAQARKDNVRGAFSVPGDIASDIHGRNVVLVDDVLTTGATAQSCARALKAAGAARVDVLVYALVLDAMRSHV